MNHFWFWVYSSDFPCKSLTNKIWARNSVLNSLNRLDGWERGMTDILKAIKSTERGRKGQWRTVQFGRASVIGKHAFLPFTVVVWIIFKDAACCPTLKVKQELKRAVSHWGHKRHRKEKQFWKSSHCFTASGQEATETLAEHQSLG